VVLGCGLPQPSPQSSKKDLHNTALSKLPDGYALRREEAQEKNLVYHFGFFQSRRQKVCGQISRN
jgi:hypothetical protein